MKKTKTTKKRKPYRKTIASARIVGVGVLRLIKSGTQFHMAINDARLESVRTSNAAKNMFKDAAEALKNKKAST